MWFTLRVCTIALCIKMVGLAVNGIGLFLCIPAGRIAVPPAFAVFVPCTAVAVGAGTICAQPPALYEFILSRISVGMEIVPHAVDLLPAVLRIPSGGIRVPPAFAVMLPLPDGGVGPGTILSVPLAFYPFICIGLAGSDFDRVTVFTDIEGF